MLRGVCKTRESIRETQMNSGSSQASTLIISALEGHVFSRVLSFLLSPREFTKFRLRKQATTAADPGTK